MPEHYSQIGEAVGAAMAHNARMAADAAKVTPTDRPTVPRLDVLIERACRHLTEQEQRALRADVQQLALAQFELTNQRETFNIAWEQQAADLERARTVAVALEQELARAEQQAAAARAECKQLQRETRGLNPHAMAGRRDAVARLLAALDAAGQPDTCQEQPVEGVRIPLPGIPECGTDCPCRRNPTR